MIRRGIWLLVLIVLVLALLMGRNGIAGYVAERWIMQTLGVTAVMGQVRTGLGFDRIEIDHLAINHADKTDWTTQVAAITGEMAPLGLFRGDAHFRTMNVVITEAVVNRDGQQFKLLHFTPPHPAELKIDQLDWSLERIKVVDTRTNPPRIRTLDVNLKQSFTGIRTVEQLEKMLLDEIVKTGVLNESPWKAGASGNTGSQFKGGLKGASDKVKSFFRKTFKKE